MCNVFKPERTHHCSQCNRCVLNMDHHCPWINNCIGFWNRKHFILLLSYVLITSYFTAFTMSYPIYLYVSEVIKVKLMFQRYNEFAGGKWKWEEARDVFLMTCLLVIDYFAAVLITMFLRFHIKLASENMTTIENFENKNKRVESRFSTGLQGNWY